MLLRREGILLWGRLRNGENKKKAKRREISEEKMIKKYLQKIYKLQLFCNINMIPGNPTGLPDEFFSFKSGGFTNGRNNRSY